MTKGQRIRARREELNLGLTELAEKAHISKQTLYKYENDIITNIPSDRIEDLARAMETTPSYIMGWNSESVEVPEMSPEEMAKAFDLFKRFQSLPPEKQAALQVLLEVPRNDA